MTYDLKNMSTRHEAIIDWLLANPQQSKAACAAHFGVTQAWLSTVMHSHLFQERLKAKGDVIFRETIVPLRERMLGIADRAYEKLGERIDHIADPKVLLDIADKTAHRLGYAPTKGPEPAPVTNNTQNNFYVVDKDLLAQARAAREQLANGGETEKASGSEILEGTLIGNLPTT